MKLSTGNKHIFRDVENYDSRLLKILDNSVQLPVTYNKKWDDSFGARGWKLNATIGDSEIIASTRETGRRVNTSVLVHDILDHLLSGFSVSGHRSEAMALIQLSERTGADPGPDFEQMVTEDILKGRINGETMKTFLPKDILNILPPNKPLTDKGKIAYLKRKIGEKELANVLVKHFYTLGHQGDEHASNSWRKLGLNINQRKKIGLALQALLVTVDFIVEKSGIARQEAFVTINNKKCCFNLNTFQPEIEQNLFLARID